MLMLTTEADTPTLARKMRYERSVNASIRS